LVVTFPLVGNYGVPSRETRDPILPDLPAHFEASEIHIAGLVVASYCGEDYSHYLAESSLGTWLKEQNVPAICGVDTRALTKRIREEGSMLGRILMQTGTRHESIPNGIATPSGAMTPAAVAPTEQSHGLSVPGTVSGYFGNTTKQVPVFEEIEWYNPNIRNLVADGELVAPSLHRRLNLIVVHSFHHHTQNLFSQPVRCVEAPVR
jgi:carbamoyl-phosphate synthase/aspartate carbamoyltransferase